jgi:DNA polymerase I-like protein with 3'-5' exonuclease and polymerase domains
MSAQKFAALLEAQGVTIENKISPTGKTIPALAKTDEFMTGLLEHHNPTVQALAAARLGHKSTLQETRTSRLISVASLPWPSYRRGNMPIPLRYSGAHTHRLSGDWGMNMQNLPKKVPGTKAGDEMRRALIAPPGHTLVVSDLSQIEARLTAWLAGCKTLMTIFATKQDPYNDLASIIFGRPINRKVDIAEGFIGKTGILGLGYGAGADKFCSMVETSSRLFGTDISAIWSTKLGQDTVKMYRKRYWEIPDLWERLDKAIWALAGRAKPFNIGPITISEGMVMGPNGLPMRYDGVRRDEETREFSYWYGGFNHKLYGAKLLENIIQYLARIIIMNTASRLAAQGLRFTMQAHDELVYVVDQTYVDKAKVLVQSEMVRRPSWGLDIPLGAETNSSLRYGEAK